MSITSQREVVNKPPRMVPGMWLMEMPLKLSTQFSKSFNSVSQRKLKLNRIDTFEQINNWLMK